MNDIGKQGAEAMADDTSLEEAKRKFNEFIEKPETTLQLHAQRYEASERSYESFARSAVLLNGGALLAVLTTEGIGKGFDSLTFTLWFVVGCVAFMVSAFSRSRAKILLLNSHVSYFPAVAGSSRELQHIRGKVRRWSAVSVYSAALSLLAFSLGCMHGFWVLDRALALP